MPHSIDGAVVVLLFLVVSTGIGLALFCRIVFVPQDRYNRGRVHALGLYSDDSTTAGEKIERFTEEARDFGEFNEFNQGMLDVKAEKESAQLETYQEAKRRGVRFASQILRNYPETGLMTLEESQIRHANCRSDFDTAFSDGIQEVLDNLRNMGK